MTSLTFRKPTSYNGYQMCFLEKSIGYRFKHSCRFTKTTFNYQLSSVHPDDITSLDKLIQAIHPELSMDYTKFYVRAQNNLTVESPNIYKVVLLFKGYKEKDTVISLIYSVMSIQPSDEKLVESEIQYWDEMTSLTFSKPTSYYGYQMYFLEEPIGYIFKHSCRFTKTPFNYQLSSVHPADIKSLDKLIQAIHPKLSMDYAKFYINAENPLTVESPNIYNVVLLFKGYKQKDTVISLIYSVMSIQPSDETLVENEIQYWDEIFE